MSYVLDALKKLEFEKARKNMNTPIAGLSGDLFRDQPARLESRLPLRYLIAVVVIVVMSSVGTWYFVRHDSHSPTAPATKSPVSSTMVLPSPKNSAPALPVPAQQLLVPPAAPQPVTVPTSPLGAAPKTQPVVSADPEDEESRPRKQRKSSSLTVVSAGTAQTALPSVQAPADIRVSGIAWQEDRRMRRVVVNGFLLQEGAVVAGARIVEIKQDRVRFALPGGTTEVRMDAAAFAAPGQ